MEPRVEVEKDGSVQPFRRDKFHKSIALSLRKLQLTELHLDTASDLSIKALKAIPDGALQIIAKDRTRIAITDSCSAIHEAGIPTPAVVQADLLAFAALARVREISALAYARYCVYHRMFRDPSKEVAEAKKALAMLVDRSCERRDQLGTTSRPNREVSHQGDARCPYCGLEQLSIYNTKSPGANTPLRRYVRCLGCRREAVYVERLSPLFWLQKGRDLQQFSLDRLQSGIADVTAKLVRPTGKLVDSSDAYRVARISAEIASREASSYSLSPTRAVLAVSNTRLSEVVADELRKVLPEEPLAFIRYTLYSAWAYTSLQRHPEAIFSIIDPVAETFFGGLPIVRNGRLRFPGRLLTQIRASSV